MWVRQIALVAHELDPVVEQLCRVLGLKVAYNDPGVAVFGLVNAVMPVGGEFLEVVQPVKDDASALRYLHRRGGDAGYMVILESDDAHAHRDRIMGLGIRKIAEHDGRYVFTHFHPGDFGGVLTSVDSVTGVENWFDPDSDWPPAGKDWRNARSENATGIRAVTIQSKTPEKQAERWAELLQGEVARGDDGPEVRMARGTIRFTGPVDEDGTGVVGLDIAMRDRAKALENAHRLGLPVDGDTVRICGVVFTLLDA